jgi:hypothetical protein
MALSPGRNKRRRRPIPWAGPLLLTVLLLVGASTSRRAVAAPARPEPPPAPKKIYDPDAGTCRPDHLESTFQAQLKPWADQPERVQERLRALQAEMLRATLQRCLGRGLLSPDEAAGVERRLGLAGPGDARSPAQPSGQRP